MKIAVIIKDYDQSRGGAERYLAGLAPRLIERGITVDLVVNRIQGSPPPGIKVKTVPAVRWSSIQAPLSFNRSVQRFLSQNHYDIIYGLTQIYPQDVYRAGGGLEHEWYAKKHRYSWQRITDYIRPRYAVRLYLENQIFRPGNVSKIITNSRLCRNQILSRYIISPEDVVVIYNGVDKEIFNPLVRDRYNNALRKQLGIPAGDRVILFISHNWRRKGLAQLIEAQARLGKDNCWLIVAGRGNPALYRRLARRLGLEDRIRFVGPIDEPQKYYGAGDIFVLPTFYDPFANVCLEALSCGLPVVTTRTNGVAEIITTGRNGYVINKPDNIDQLARYIKQAFLLSKTDRKAISDSIAKFTIKRNVEQSLKVLEDALRSKGKGEGGIIFTGGYRELLQRRGWFSFGDIMKEQQGVLYKKNRYRSVVKITAEEKDLFLKRHFRGNKCSWALREWQNIFRLKALGVQTVNPVVMAQRGRESFIITESLEPMARLEDIISKACLPVRQKKILIYRLAQLTRRLHDNNLFHKDFYAGHIFVQPTAAVSGQGGLVGGENKDDFDLYLIDVQRLREHLCRRGHWRTKDLASLNFSVGQGLVKNSDKIRFLEYYWKGTFMPRGRRRKIIGRIMAKTERIARHTEKLLQRRNKDRSNQQPKSK